MAFGKRAAPGHSQGDAQEDVWARHKSCDLGRAELEDFIILPDLGHYTPLHGDSARRGKDFPQE